MILNAIIAQNYCDKNFFNFILEVVYDEYFSFGLKRRIIEKIISNLDKRILEDLNRLNTIRNYFAHCNQEFFKGRKKPELGQKGFIPDPKNTKKEIDFERLYLEFIDKEKKVNKYFGEILKENTKMN